MSLTFWSWLVVGDWILSCGQSRGFMHAKKTLIWRVLADSLLQAHGMSHSFDLICIVVDWQFAVRILCLPRPYAWFFEWAGTISAAHDRRSFLKWRPGVMNISSMPPQFWGGYQVFQVFQVFFVGGFNDFDGIRGNLVCGLEHERIMTFQILGMS